MPVCGAAFSANMCGLQVKTEEYVRTGVLGSRQQVREDRHRWSRNNTDTFAVEQVLAGMSLT